MAAEAQSWKQFHERVGKQFHAARVGMVDGVEHHRRVGDALPPKPAVALRSIGEGDVVLRRELAQAGD